jgi:hypothetical protein
MYRCQSISREGLPTLFLNSQFSLIFPVLQIFSNFPGFSQISHRLTEPRESTTPRFRINCRFILAPYRNIVATIESASKSSLSCETISAKLFAFLFSVPSNCLQVFFFFQSSSSGHLLPCQIVFR